MTKKSFLGKLLFLSVICLQCRNADHSNKAGAENNNHLPNIVILFADDMGYGDLSSYGNPTIKTPHLDALADEGMRFTSYEAAPWCVPSRAELMTGQYFPRIPFGEVRVRMVREGFWIVKSPLPKV